MLTQLHPFEVRAIALDAVGDAICITNADGRIVHVNPAFEAATGMVRADAVGKECDSILAPGVNDALLPEIAAALATGQTWHGELWLQRVDGRPLLARVACSPMEGGHMVSSFRDITAFRRNAEAARRVASSFRTLIEGSPDGIAVHRHGRFVYVNPAFLACLGQDAPEDIVGTAVVDAVHADDRAGLLAMVASAEAQPSTEKRLLRRDGKVVQAEVTSLPVEFDGEPGFALIARDLTARRAMETRLREMDRMVSIGTLAAGIAHEINTPIQFVGDSAHFLQGALTDLMGLLAAYRRLRDEVVAGGWAPELVAEVDAEEEVVDLPYLQEHCPRAISRTLEGVSRVATIVRALKEFGHPGQTEMSPADLNNALTNTVAVARSEWRYVAEVRTEFADLPPVLCHVQSMNQVFLNLLVNGAHAIGDVVRDTDQKGEIVIRTAVEGAHVHISISDTGSGIPEAVRARIFDPFFTTKEVGRGTGQGLAIARSIVVEKHRGTLHFETELGRGTTFHILLPLTTSAS